MPLPSLTALGLKVHPLRDELDQEFHARPFERLKTPSLISHLALLSGPGREAIDQDRAQVARLCDHYGVTAPAPGAVHLSVACGRFRLKSKRIGIFRLYLHRPGGKR